MIVFVTWSFFLQRYLNPAPGPAGSIQEQQTCKLQHVLHLIWTQSIKPALPNTQYLPSLNPLGGKDLLARWFVAITRPLFSPFNTFPILLLGFCLHRTASSLSCVCVIPIVASRRHYVHHSTPPDSQRHGTTASQTTSTARGGVICRDPATTTTTTTTRVKNETLSRSCSSAHSKFTCTCTHLEKPEQIFPLLCLFSFALAASAAGRKHLAGDVPTEKGFHCTVVAGMMMTISIRVRFEDAR